jgi:hypothetical protein
VLQDLIIKMRSYRLHLSFDGKLLNKNVLLKNAVNRQEQFGFGVLIAYQHINWHGNSLRKPAQGTQIVKFFRLSKPYCTILYDVVALEP